MEAMAAATTSSPGYRAELSNDPLWALITWCQRDTPNCGRVALFEYGPSACPAGQKTVSLLHV